MGAATVDEDGEAIRADEAIYTKGGWCRDTRRGMQADRRGGVVGVRRIGKVRVREVGCCCLGFLGVGDEEEDAAVASV